MVVKTDISVVIVCHSLERLDLLIMAIESVKAQMPSPASIIVGVDHQPELLKIVRSRYDDIRVVANEFQKGASGTRNTAAVRSDSSFIAFLDDDACARPGWLHALREPLEDEKVVCTGGLVIPRWLGAAPKWFPYEFAWVVGASYTGGPTAIGEVRNVWGENMAVRHSTFDLVGGFRASFGKVGAASQPEDTDLCIRLGKSGPEASIIFTPSAVVDHHVGIERSTFSYFMKRSFNEGRGKVELARDNGGSSELTDESLYLKRVIPDAMKQYLKRGVKDRDLNQLHRGSALLAGIGAAGIGGIVSSISRR